MGLLVRWNDSEFTYYLESQYYEMKDSVILKGYCGYYEFNEKDRTKCTLNDGVKIIDKDIIGWSICDYETAKHIVNVKYGK